MGVHPGDILEIVIASVAVAFVMGVIGLLLWYVKVKPDIEDMRLELQKKAAADDLEKVNTDLRHKREDSERIQEEIDMKQNKTECDLMRKGCQPLIAMHLGSLEEKVDNLQGAYTRLEERIDRWMRRNGG